MQFSIDESCYIESSGKVKTFFVFVSASCIQTREHMY